MKRLAICALAALAWCGAAEAQSPMLPYSVHSSATKPVGDNTNGSAPMPVTCVSGCTGGGGGGTVAPTPASSTDIGGTVTSGGAYQTVAASSGARLNCTVENNDASKTSEPLLVKIGTQTQPYNLSYQQSITALNGVVVATDTITVTAATTGHTFAGTCQ